jgi:hypothetical protein
MNISKKTNIHDLLETYPYLEDFLAQRNTLYKNLKNPLMRNTIGRIATLEKVAGMSGEDIDELIGALEKEIQLKGLDGFKSFIRKKFVDPEKKARLKDIIIALHEGEDPEILKKQFAALVREVTATEIADLEQSLIDDGLPEREVRRLCDLHVAIFEESLSAQAVPDLGEGHPIHTFMLENRQAEKLIARIQSQRDECGTPPDITRLQRRVDQIEELLTDFGAISIHYTRKENQLFPLLEKHGVTAPTQVMWSIHDDIRDLYKKTNKSLTENDLTEMCTALDDLLKQAAGMIYKEEHILFPMSLDVLSEEDWQAVRRGEDAIGYAWIDPPPTANTLHAYQAKTALSRMLELQTGTLTMEQVNLMLTHLPVDISFVDENDKVAYYSDCPDRIFPRSPAVIGRAVQNCHPPDSVDTVNKILKAFRNGDQRTADFWINLGGKFISIQYFAMFDKQGTYRGCLEVSQDVTKIRELAGEKRLLDWE